MLQAQPPGVDYCARGKRQQEPGLGIQCEEEYVVENKPAGVTCHSNITVEREGQLSSRGTPRFLCFPLRDTSWTVVVIPRSWMGDVVSGRKRAWPCQT